MKEANFTAWHFLAPDHRLGNGDGRLIVAGETLFVEGQIEICRHGMRWSRRALDALDYAPGDHVSLVVPVGDILEDEKEGVSQGRKTLWIADASGALRDFSRWCALSVAHLWDMPPIVRKYLETGDESLREEARGEAMAAARGAAWDAAAAAWNAVWDAAWGVAKDAAMAAAEDAAWDSAEDAVWDAVWDAGWVSARVAQNAELEKRLMAMAPQDCSDANT